MRRAIGFTIAGLGISLAIAALAGSQGFGSQRTSGQESTQMDIGRWLIPRMSPLPGTDVPLDVPSGRVPAPLPEGGAATMPEPLVGPTTGTLIGEQAAREKASSLAQGPIARQDVRLLAYRDISAFAGSVITTIHPGRLFYMVVTAAPWQPTYVRGTAGICPSYIAVIDAESAQTRGILCGNAQWPTRLPTEFGR